MARRRPPLPAELEAIETELLLQGVFRRYGYDFRSYDPGFVARRLRRRRRLEGLPTLAGLSERLLRDPGLLERVLDDLARPEASLFSPAGFWRALRRKVAPYLRTYPTLRLWSVEASPAEVYSLSILLEEDVPRNVRIYATGLREEGVERARTGAMPSAALASGAKAYRRSGGRRDLSRYFEREAGAAVLSPPLRRKIVFAAHRLATDGPFQSFHAIVAPGLLEGFGEALRERALRFLHASLLPLGFLALGTSDAAPRGRYREVDRAAGLYQKLED